MASEFYMPDWAFAPPSPPEPSDMPSANALSIPDEAYGASGALALIEPGQELAPEFWDEADRANAARVDDLNNDFIEQQRAILHTGDAAFFNRTGHDALLAAPEVHAKLDALREETLGRAANDVQREWLNETLGKHSVVEHFDIGDHVGRQSVVWQKAVNRRRLDNLEQQAAADHAIPGAVEALANASESSARDHARASGLRPDSPEAQAEVDIARSSVFRHAIEGALAKGAHSAAIKLHERARDKLVPGDAEFLDKIIEDAREMKIGKDYVAKIAPLSITINTSLEDLDKAQDEATARNNEDWKDNDKQRAANQHFLNVQFGKAKHQGEADKAKLAQTVHEWLTTPGADGLLQTERPSLVIWGKLTPEERKGVDTVLETNARGGKTSEGMVHDPSVILTQANMRDVEEAQAAKPDLSGVNSLPELQRKLEKDTPDPKMAGEDARNNRVDWERVDDGKDPNIWKVKWKLAHKSPRGGVIVQHIVRTNRDGTTYQFWEAWKVDPGTDRPSGSEKVEHDDVFRLDENILPDSRERAKGQKTTATVQFYEGLRYPPPGFDRGKAPGAGKDQFSALEDPKLPQEIATEKRQRPEWIVQ